MDVLEADGWSATTIATGPVIDSVLESGHSKHDEGDPLSGHTRSCVEAVRQR